MITLLAHWFHIDQNGEAGEARRKYGILTGAVGIFLNLLLFGCKLAAGLLSGAISIVADAFNNLSDASSSLISLLGFHMAGKRADSGHPFGHGRMEYVSALVVSMLIVVMGVELLISSVKSMLHPVALEVSWLTGCALVFSILVKLYMYFYNRKVGKRIDAAALTATAADSLSDCISTAVVLLCMLIFSFTNVNLDAWCGILVSLFILYTGTTSAWQVIDRLMGKPPDPKMVQQIQELVLSHDQIFGLHDLIVHDYGPGRLIISLHAEVPADADILSMHDTIDNIEGDLAADLGCLAIIHMDPIVVNDPVVNGARLAVAGQMQQLHPDTTIHDFRMVPGPTHSNLIFDVVLPYAVKLNDEEARSRVAELVRELDPSWRVVVNIDRSFTD